MGKTYVPKGFDKNKVVYRIPTKTDVDLLIENIGIPKPGDFISYESITAITGVKHRSARWQSVTTSWKGRLEKYHGVFMRAIHNEGYEVLTDGGRVEFCDSMVDRGAKQIQRGFSALDGVDRIVLTDEQKVIYDHNVVRQRSIALASAAATKAIEFPDPTVIPTRGRLQIAANGEGPEEKAA